MALLTELEKRKYILHLFIFIVQTMIGTLNAYVENTCTALAFESTYMNQGDSICIFEEHWNTNFNFKLAKSVSNWRFTKPHSVFASFPVDPIPDNYIREVSNVIFSYVKPTPFQSKIKLAAYSRSVVEGLLDMDPHITEETKFLQIFSGNVVHPTSKPLAHRYGGHQFGYWSGQLGDGRAHFLGEFVNQKGDRWELQLKGSGKTPYSRRGDGRAVIRSSVREFLCSEAMHYLGIPTSRAATLIVSNDFVIRDQFYNGNRVKERTAVVLRLAPSWFRIGSLEILQQNNEIHLLKEIVDFMIEHFFPQIPNENSNDNKYLEFFSEVVNATAHMVAQWQSVGFTHGVCNTDNFSLLSITIDYGPFGFMDNYDPDLVPNTSDDEHRYSYENQPAVAAFNMDKLRLALLPLISDTKKQQLQVIHNGYSSIYKEAFMKIFRKKLGIMYDENNKETDEQLVAILLKMMEETKSDWTMTFRQLGDWSYQDMKLKKIKNLWSIENLQSHKWFSDWVQIYTKRLSDSEVSDQKRRQQMHNVNPIYILRNWIAQDVIAATEKDEFSLIEKVSKILQNPFTKQEEAESLGFSSPPPPWASTIKVSCSS